MAGLRSCFRISVRPSHVSTCAVARLSDFPGVGAAGHAPWGLTGYRPLRCKHRALAQTRGLRAGRRRLAPAWIVAVEPSSIAFTTS